MKEIMAHQGIHHQTSVAYNPPQNGRAERINRTILDKARSMLADSGLENRFWAEAVATATYLINHSPHSKLDGRMPEEIWSGKVPSLKHL